MYPALLAGGGEGGREHQHNCSYFPNSVGAGEGRTGSLAKLTRSGGVRRSRGAQKSLVSVAVVSVSGPVAMLCVLSPCVLSQWDFPCECVLFHVGLACTYMAVFVS